MTLRFFFIWMAVAFLNSPILAGPNDGSSIELIVQLSDGGAFNYETCLDGEDTVLQAVTLAHYRTLSRAQQIVLLSYEVRPEFAANDRDVQAIQARLKSVLGSRRDVLHIQENRTLTERAIPNDPSYSGQWHHENASDRDIDSEAAWDITTGGQTALGHDIVVCVIEGGGSNFNHIDLNANHWVNAAEVPGNGIDDDGNGYVDDYNGWNPVEGNDNIPSGDHGTSVSGMIGAKAQNDFGGAGVNWDVQIMQVTVGPLTEANVIEAYDYALTMRSLWNASGGTEGALVVATNASWGIDFGNPADAPVWCGFYDALGEAGILNCGATANQNVNIDTVGDLPTGCTSPYMIAVTATDVNDERTFSGYGTESIDLGAPGQAVLLPEGTTAYAGQTGTSFASPCVAGAIALMYAHPDPALIEWALADPQGAADAVRTALLDGVDPVENLSEETATGGRLNVNGAMEALGSQLGAQGDCAVTNLSGVGFCVYSASLDQVVPLVNLTASFSNASCIADELCYSTDMGESWDCYVPNGLDGTNATHLMVGLPQTTSLWVTVSTAGMTSDILELSLPDCAAEISGCTDASAVNFDPDAAFDDGSCVFPCTPIILTVMTDCWGPETGWTLTSDETGEVLNEEPTGQLEDLVTVTWEGCVPDGCYTFTIIDTFGDGLAGTQWISCGIDGDYSIDTQFGDNLVSMPVADFDTEAVHPFCVTYEPQEGCTDLEACNYVEWALIEDGSCLYPFTPCDDGNPDTEFDETDADCNCVGILGGCLDESACNFNPEAEFSNGNCTYPGCLAPTACNFDPSAGCMDLDQCDFGICECFGDFNGDGFRNAEDLLMMLGEFTCTMDCTTDLDEDGQVSISDILAFLAVLGLPCE